MSVASSQSLGGTKPSVGVLGLFLKLPGKKRCIQKGASLGLPRFGTHSDNSVFQSVLSAHLSASPLNYEIQGARDYVFLTFFSHFFLLW